MRRSLFPFAAVAWLVTAGDVARAGEPPLSPNCQARLELTEEVTRLLVKAASHATSSRSCIDGPGNHLVVGRVLVCPADETKDVVTVDASYRVTWWAEGDTRGCRHRKRGPQTANQKKRRWPDRCRGLPAITEYRARFHFKRQGKAYRIEIPDALPGIDTDRHRMTPLDKAHDGGCYGKSGPFVPAPIEL